MAGEYSRHHSKHTVSKQEQQRRDNPAEQQLEHPFQRKVMQALDQILHQRIRAEKSRIQQCNLLCRHDEL